MPDKIDAYTYASVQNQAGLYDGSGEYSAYSQEEMEIIRNQSDPYKYPNTDWYNIALKKLCTRISSFTFNKRQSEKSKLLHIIGYI